MSKHTKGPWVWELVEGPQLVPEYTLKGPKVLCRWWRMRKEHPEPADARLIAASPDAPKVVMDLVGSVQSLMKAETISKTHS